MFCANLLRGKMAEHQMSQKKLSQILGISEKTFSEKMAEKYDWSLTETQKICKALTIVSPKEIIKIFYP